MFTEVTEPEKMTGMGGETGFHRDQPKPGETKERSELEVNPTC